MSAERSENFDGSDHIAVDIYGSPTSDDVVMLVDDRVYYVALFVNITLYQDLEQMSEPSLKINVQEGKTFIDNGKEDAYARRLIQNGDIGCVVKVFDKTQNHFTIEEKVVFGATGYIMTKQTYNIQNN